MLDEMDIMEHENRFEPIVVTQSASISAGTVIIF